MFTFGNCDRLPTVYLQENLESLSSCRPPQLFQLPRSSSHLVTGTKDTSEQGCSIYVLLVKSLQEALPIILLIGRRRHASLPRYKWHLSYSIWLPLHNSGNLELSKPGTSSESLNSSEIQVESIRQAASTLKNYPNDSDVLDCCFKLVWINKGLSEDLCNASKNRMRQIWARTAHCLHSHLL